MRGNEVIMGFLKKDTKLISVEFVPDPLDKVLEELADEIFPLKKDEEYHLNDFSTELLCDYITLNFHVLGLLEYKCMDELTDRVLTASLEEILALAVFLGERKSFSEQYVFTIKFVLHKLLGREDRVDFFRKFYDAGGFHLLNIQIDVHGFMQYSQNYREKT